MIEFRQKDFSIKEGHYTGPKDMDKVPGAVEVVGKSALAGSLLGAAVGKIMKDTTTLQGAIKGAEYGGLGGILLKFFINYLHKPMSRVKFAEVDRNIRREFGIYRVAGITVGDKIDKRADIDEKFGFSDRQVTNYKLNFAVQNDKVTMYTFDLSNDELNKVDKILDYYCKKYTGMEYTSDVINYKLNSYSVDIVFTNYQVISNFIMELSNELGCKINLLDNKALVDGRLKDTNEVQEETKNFSVAGLNKFEALKILGKAGMGAAIDLKKGPGVSFASFLIGLLSGLAEKLSADELIKSGHPAPRESFGNKYIEDVLKKNKFTEGLHYSVLKKSGAPINISMISGLFIVTADKGKVSEKVDKWYKSWQLKMGRKDTGKAIVYTYTIQSRKEFEYMLLGLMKIDEDINIFEG